MSKTLKMRFYAAICFLLSVYGFILCGPGTPAAANNDGDTTPGKNPFVPIV